MRVYLVLRSFTTLVRAWSVFRVQGSNLSRALILSFQKTPFILLVRLTKLVRACLGFRVEDQNRFRADQPTDAGGGLAQERSVGLHLASKTVCQ